jgi:cytochrome c-type biogenesis protein CcmH/NrfG
LGRFDDALQSFAQANELEPENSNYKVDYARMLRLKGERIEEVKTLLEEAVAVNPGELRSIEELAYAYEASNNPEAAINVMGAHLEEVLEMLR